MSHKITLCVMCKEMKEESDMYWGYNRSLSDSKVMYQVCKACIGKEDFSWAIYNENLKKNLNPDNW